MDMYLIWFALTPQAWAGLLDNPEDRRQVLEPVFAGGRRQATRLLVSVR